MQLDQNCTPVERGCLCSQASCKQLFAARARPRNRCRAPLIAPLIACRAALAGDTLGCLLMLAMAACSGIPMAATELTASSSASARSRWAAGPLRHPGGARQQLQPRQSCCRHAPRAHHCRAARPCAGWWRSGRRWPRMWRRRPWARCTSSTLRPAAQARPAAPSSCLNGRQQCAALPLAPPLGFTRCSACPPPALPAGASAAGSLAYVVHASGVLWPFFYSAFCSLPFRLQLLEQAAVGGAGPAPPQLQALHPGLAAWLGAVCTRGWCPTAAAGAAPHAATPAGRHGAAIRRAPRVRQHLGAAPRLLRASHAAARRAAAAAACPGAGRLCQH